HTIDMFCSIERNMRAFEAGGAKIFWPDLGVWSPRDPDGPGRIVCEAAVDLEATPEAETEGRHAHLAVHGHAQPERSQRAHRSEAVQAQLTASAGDSALAGPRRAQRRAVEAVKEIEHLVRIRRRRPRSWVLVVEPVGRIGSSGVDRRRQLDPGPLVVG